ncbi:putative glycerol kinase [Seiridium cardinale]|uniref:glycerol kinase n=1 Tax=Seiridium cardinale TaxID=138064 RepID=A0ABR2Y2D3_9PEZI
MTTGSRERKRTRPDEHMPEINGTNGQNGTNGVSGEHKTNGVNGVHGKTNPNPDDWFVGSVDQGTTSSRFIIFSSQADIVASHQIEFDNHYPESGWHEHDPYDLVQSVEECIEEAVKQFTSQGYDVSQIKAIGLTNQRETTLCWDKVTGEPLCNAVVWPDTRTKELVRELKIKRGADQVLERSGLPLSTYPSSVKLVWLLRYHEGVKKAYDESRLAFGTVDTWLIYRLNGGPEKNVHVTDTTNASRTMFMNLRTLKYDDELLSFFDIDPTKVSLPEIVPSSCPKMYGKIAKGALAGVKICGCLGDQSAALVGQCGFQPGQAKNTYGTGCFLLYNVGKDPVISKYGLLCTIAYDFGDNGEPVYALEGSVAVGGSGVKFLMHNLGFERDSHRVSELAESVKDNGGVFFVTAFSGLFAPYWIDDAKGTLFGITQHTQKGHIARATLEATCFQTRAILDAMEKDSGHRLESLAVDGGMSNSDLTMQTQADLSGIRVERPAMRETTALGAAIAAGIAHRDCWSSLKQIQNLMKAKQGRREFVPEMEKRQVAKMYGKWERAVEMSRGWVVDESEDEDD